MLKVSVIVPIYNNENYLNKCLESIINQSLKDIEVICVNDGSTDKSLAIVKYYAQKDERIKIINQVNKGQGAARNAALKTVTGKYISFVDSDDTITPNFLEILYNVCEEYSSDISSGVLAIANKKIKTNSKNKILHTFEEKMNYIKNGSCCDKLFSKDLIHNNNIDFPEGIYYEDNLFLIKALYYSNILVCDSEAVYIYSDNNNSTTRAKNNRGLLKNSLPVLINSIFDFILPIGSFSEIEAVKNYILRGCVSYRVLFDSDIFSVLPQILKEDMDVLKLGKKVIYRNFFEYLFSLKNSIDGKYKVVTIIGIKFYILRKNNHG